MARIQIPIDALTSRLNIQDRFNSMRSGGLTARFANLRPISEFFDMKRLSKPANFGEVQSRWNYNLSHFSSNYSVVFLMLSIYALLTNWLLLFDIIFVIAGMFLIGKLDGRDLEIGTFRASTSQLWTGLLVIAIPVGLFASPFSTLLWLIGASGVVILGHAAFMDKPIDEAFSGEAGAAQQGYWEDGQRVEELESEEGESDTQGVGLVSRGKRIASDPLRFTGTDLGDRTGASRRGYEYQPSDDDDDSEDDSEEDDEDGSSDDSEGELEIDWDALSPMEREEALVHTALTRIRRAQEKGKADVKLNKEEMAALERHKKRMEKEARRQERKRRKEKEQRYSIPLAQFDMPPRRSLAITAEDDLPLHPSPGTFAETQRDAMPPVGYFPPPNVSRTRQRTSTSSSQPPNMSPASSTSSMSRSKSGVDPFQFQTEGPRAASTVASRRNVSGSTDGRRTPVIPPTTRVTRSTRAPQPEEESSEDSSEEESTEESTSDGTGNGAQIVQPPKPPPPVRRGRKEAIVVEEAASRDPARESSRGKKSSNPSPSKRKPVGGRKKKK
ncbi:prenylated rab acceptor 1 [Colletotrichum plurivorum]|uniref:Prenylated rab acceptor 1 n=1 Tax=Colletotrichum plurivorum TaxID=2175906 RepID=A0A8H6NEQ2_9PEZI|nr:prenylated rab acceptor 1 [Colletotrichum plurivorum]